MKKIYVACPFSDEDKLVIKNRMIIFDAVIAYMINDGYLPLSACLFHPLAQRDIVAGNWKFWKDGSEELIFVSDEVWVLQLDGWEKSEGIRGEVKCASFYSINIKFIDPYKYLKYGIVE